MPAARFIRRIAEKMLVKILDGYGTDIASYGTDFPGYGNDLTVD